MNKTQLKKEISTKLSSENIFFYNKGRVALYAILRAMNVGKDDEVILPAYTCVVVPNPIIYLGAKPIYVDINQETFNTDANKIEAKITRKTKVIICQNTYGLSSDLEKINAIAQRHNLYTIEDCTHGYGSDYNGKPNGTSCDAAFFSTQWNKPFSSGVGGFSLINNKKILAQIIELESKKIPLPSARKLSLNLQYLAKRFLINDITYWTLLGFYRSLTQNNILSGSSSHSEISSVKMPNNFFMDFSEVQAREALRTLTGLDKLNKLRKENAKIYTDFLKKNNKKYVLEKYHANHGFLKYPILVQNREKFKDLAQKNHIPLGDWFISPLHPVTENFDNWYFHPQNYPIAVKSAKQVLNLPTEHKNPQRILNFLRTNIDYLL